MKKPRYIVSDSRICGGKPCFKGTRIPIAVVLGYLAAGVPMQKIQEDFPKLRKAAILEAIGVASVAVNFEDLDIPAA